MEVVFVIILVIAVAYTLLSGLAAIIETWNYCLAVGSTKGFFSYIFKASAGSVIVILGILLLCVPVYVILNIVIYVKKKNSMWYRVQVFLNTDKQYQQAYEMFKNMVSSGVDRSVVEEQICSELVRSGVSEEEAKKSVTMFYFLETMNS